jgi:hypothetical protein
MPWDFGWLQVEVKEPVPQTTDQLDDLSGWFPDAAVQSRILVKNPGAFMDSSWPAAFDSPPHLQICMARSVPIL